MTSSPPFKRGRLLVITGPSGVGKGTVVEQLLNLAQGLRKSVSVTTRLKREKEVEGVDYFFRNQEEFKAMVNANEFMEWAEFAGSFYGTPKQWVEAQLADGIDVVLEIEVEGAKQIKASHPDCLLIFLSPPTFTALEERLRSRGTETPDKLALRLAKAKQELQEKSLFDYEVINDNVQDAVNNLLRIVYAERCRIGAGGDRLS